MRSSSGSRLLRGAPEVILPNSLMSAPATNVRPAPITTAALTAASRLISSIAAQIPSGTPGPSAFTGGLSIVMTATSFSLPTFTRLLIFPKLLPARLILLAQISFQNFPRRGLGQALAKLNRLRTLVVSQPSPAKFDQFHFAECGSRLRHYYRLRHLAPCFVGHRDHRRFVNAGMR